MAGGRVFSNAPANISNMNMNILLQNQQQTPRGNSSQQSLDSLFLSSSASFFGSRSMVSFEDVQGRKRCNRSFFGGFDLDENGEDEMDEYFHQSEKKRRLSVDQVQFLEKSFEEDNKLEPERKTKLAKDLGLQPRQVAIWFQNRRARWKTKQLEKDYDSLNDSFESLKTDYDNLLKEKDRLQSEVASLTEKVLAREKQEGKFKQGESETKEFLHEPPMNKPLVDSVSEGEGSKLSIVEACNNNKHEDISSARSDILDCDSPRYTDGVLETGDSSYAFEHEYQSDLSQDEEDNLLPPYIFTKLEDVNYSDPPHNSSSYEFQEEDHHQALWPWSY